MSKLPGTPFAGLAKTVLAAWFLLTLTGVIPAAEAQPNDQETLQSLRRDLDELIKGQIDLQRQVAELKTLVQSQGARPFPSDPAPAPRANFVIQLAGLPMLGESNAAVTMIEFSDYQCPYCARFATETFPQIEKDYIQSGKVRYVVWDFPLALHPLAQKAAEAARCANAQGEFWNLRAALFGNQPGLTTNRLADLARQTSLDTNEFSQCFWTGQETGSVTRQVAQAAAAGVTGTPTFFIGLTGTNRASVNISSIIVGAKPYAEYQAALDGLLAAGK